MATVDNGRVPALTVGGAHQDYMVLAADVLCTLEGDHMCSYCEGCSQKHTPLCCSSRTGWDEARALLQRPITTVGVLYPSLGVSPTGRFTP